MDEMPESGRAPISDSVKWLKLYLGLPFDFSVPSTPFPQDRVGSRGHK